MNASIITYLIFPVLHVLGPVLIWFGAVMLIPYGVSLYKADGADFVFAQSAAATITIGLLLTIAFWKFKREMTAQHGFLVVTLSWTAIAAAATLPIMLYLPQYSFIEAFFETMSCLTTTGATMMTDIDGLPISINGWRCLLAWIGGMGLIVFSVAILPLLGVGGAQIMKAEMSGPLKETRLTPRIAETARALYLIYFGLSVVSTIAYHLAGMDWDDAVMHMMTTVSLSGISPHDASFGYFNNPAVDLVAIVFMAICGCNFAMHFLVWRKRNPLLYFRDPETLGWFGVLASLTAILTLVLMHDGIETAASDALRTAAFVVFSTASTTGYTHPDLAYSAWPPALTYLLMGSAAFSTCAGSTGGGIRMIRVIILLKEVSREFKHLLMPNAVFPLMVGRTVISRNIFSAVCVYFIVWILSISIGSIALMISGLGTIEALSSAYACITNLGIPLGALEAAGNFSSLTDLQLGICTFLMLLGRLELFTVLILFTRAFWRH